METIAEDATGEELEKIRMSYLFLLSQGNRDLAKEEVLSISLDPSVCQHDENIMVAETALNFKRLALTKTVYLYLFSCPRSEIVDAVKKFDWNSVYKGSYRVRVRRANRSVAKADVTEKDIAGLIWDKLDEPKVDLKYARSKIDVLLTEKNAYVGTFRYKINGEFAKRKSHMRPHNQPTSLDPKIARACVNISGVRTGEQVVDPFCGAGGILLEAGLMRFATRGYDIDSSILRKCENNLDYYKVKRFTLEKKDAVLVDEQMDHVVTDLPYGQSSALSGDREKLYLGFLENLASVLKHKAVVIFPSHVDHKKLIAKTDFSIEKEFSVYVHSSLTRNIVLLKKS